MTSPVFRLLMLGDLQPDVLFDTEQRSHGGVGVHLAALQPFLESSDAVIASLDAPTLPDQNRGASLDTDGRPYVERAAAALAALGVNAVNLASPRWGERSQDLVSTVGTFEEAGIHPFGAGTNLELATRPFTLQLPEPLNGGEIVVHGGLPRPRAGTGQPTPFADESSSGSAPFSNDDLAAREPIRRSDEGLLIAYPRWGTDDGWRTRHQRLLGTAMLRRDFDLVIGHGAPALQQVEVRRRRWVLYGIGPACPSAAEEPANADSPPAASFWAMLEVMLATQDERHVALKLYPVGTSTGGTGQRTGPVSQEGLSEVVEQIRQHTARSDRFDNDARSVGEDSLGPFIQLEVGSWKVGEQPARLPSRLPAESVSAGSVVHAQESHTPGEPAVDGEYPRADTVGWGYYNISAQLLAVELLRRGHSLEWFSRRWFAFRIGGQVMSFYEATSHLTSRTGVRAAHRKDVAKHLLAAAGLPVPQGRTFNRSEYNAARKFIRGWHVPVVTKPVDGNKGRGVTVAPDPSGSLEGAWKRAVAATGPSGLVMVEQQFSGEEMRVLTVGGVGVAVYGKRPPTVEGDGHRSIAELVEAKNAERFRNPHLYSRLIKLDENRQERITRAGYSLGSVLAGGEEFILDHNANLSTGGESVDITEKVHPGYFQVASAAANALPGLDITGIDLIAADWNQAPTAENHVVIEVNTQPSLGTYHFPAVGDTRDAAGSVIDYCVDGRPPAGPLPPRSPMPGDRMRAPGLAEN